MPPLQTYAIKFWGKSNCEIWDPKIRSVRTSTNAFFPNSSTKFTIYAYLQRLRNPRWLSDFDFHFHLPFLIRIFIFTATLIFLCIFNVHFYFHCHLRLPCWPWFTAGFRFKFICHFNCTSAITCHVNFRFPFDLLFIFNFFSLPF